MSTVATVVYGVLLMLGSATTNFLMTILVVKYKSRLTDSKEEILMREQHRQMYAEYKLRHKINGEAIQ